MAKYKYKYGEYEYVFPISHLDLGQEQRTEEAKKEEGTNWLEENSRQRTENSSS